MAHWLLTTTDSSFYQPLRDSQLYTWETSRCDHGKHVIAGLEPGDDVALLRTGGHGGIVAHGQVSTVLNRHTTNDRGYCDLHLINARFTTTYLGNPLPLAALPGLGPATQALHTRSSRRDRVPLELTDAVWQTLLTDAGKPRDHQWPISWEIPIGAVVNRADVHQAYGGQRQGVIVHSASTPNTFVFLGAGPFTLPYTHRFTDDGTLLLVGKPEQLTSPPQPGTPVTSGENRYVTAHLRAGYPVRVFHSRGRRPSLYLGEVVIDQQQMVDRWIEVSADDARRRPSRRDRKLARPYPAGLPAPAPARFYAPLLRVHPVTELQPFLDPQQAPRRRPRSLRLQVSTEPAGAATPDAGLADGEVIRRAAALLAGPDREALLEVVDTDALASLITRHRRRQGLDELRRLVRDPKTRELQLQKVLEQHSWMFGGDYMGLAVRRRLSLSEELDIPLIRGDGTLHGVEIKCAYEPKLIEIHRGRAAAGTPVHWAVVQAMNYLRSLDEQRAQIQDEYEIDCQRASMTVVIGHPMFVRDRFTPAEIAAALRTYNAQLSRINVITYAELIEGAERSLLLAEPVTVGERRR